LGRVPLPPVLAAAQGTAGGCLGNKAAAKGTRAAAKGTRAVGVASEGILAAAVGILCWLLVLGSVPPWVEPLER